MDKLSSSPALSNAHLNQHQQISEIRDYLGVFKTLIEINPADRNLHSNLVTDHLKEVFGEVDDSSRKEGDECEIFEKIRKLFRGFETLMKHGNAKAKDILIGNLDDILLMKCSFLPQNSPSTSLQSQDSGSESYLIISDKEGVETDHSIVNEQVPNDGLCPEETNNDSGQATRTGRDREQQQSTSAKSKRDKSPPKKNDRKVKQKHQQQQVDSDEGSFRIPKIRRPLVEDEDIYSDQHEEDSLRGNNNNMEVEMSNTTSTSEEVYENSSSITEPPPLEAIASSSKTSNVDEVTDTHLRAFIVQACGLSDDIIDEIMNNPTKKEKLKSMVAGQVSKMEKDSTDSSTSNPPSSPVVEQIKTESIEPVEETGRITNISGRPRRGATTKKMPMKIKTKLVPHNSEDASGGGFDETKNN